MAGRKEFEMMFMLNATMSNTFNSTFSQAQIKLQGMQNEIQALSKVQSNISAYERQQAAVENTTRKLQELQACYANVQKEIAESGQFSSKLANEELKIAGNIEKTSAKLDEQKGKLEKTGQALTEAGVDTSKLGEETKRLSAEMSALKISQEAAATSAQRFGQQAAEAISGIQSALVSAGIIEGISRISDAFNECVNVSVAFEASMSDVQAIAGASTSEIAQLAEKAKELGATTMFTAQQSSEAMSYMAAAGWEASDMLSGMGGVLDLAAASGEDLAMVADIVTNNLTAFGLSAADSAHFADVLAVAAAASNTDVYSMGETFKNVASVAGALKYSVEDVSVAIGLMANSGIKGSLAGTALKNILTGLLEGCTLTSAAFGEYEYTAIKADGTTKTFRESMDELRSTFAQMTEAERVNNAITIAGTRSFNGLLAVINASDSEYAKMADSINNCSGAASRMAEIRMDNVQGQITKMNSAFEALQNSLGELVHGSLRGFYEVMTTVAGGVNDFVKQNPALVKGILATAGVIGLSTAGFAAFTIATKAAAVAMTAFTASIPIVGTVLTVAAGVGALVGAVSALDGASSSSTLSLKDLASAAQGLDEAMQAATDAYNDTVVGIETNMELADIYISELERLEAESGAAARSTQDYAMTLSLLEGVMPSISEHINQETGELMSSTAALRENVTQWEKRAKAEAMQEMLTEKIKAQTKAEAELRINETSLKDSTLQLTRAQEELKSVQTQLEPLLRTQSEAQFEAAWGYNEATSAASSYSASIAELQERERELNNEISTLQGNINAYSDAVRLGETEMSGYAAELERTKQAVLDMSQANIDLGDTSVLTAQESAQLSAVIGDVENKVLSLNAAYEQSYTASLSSIQGQHQLWDEVANVVPTSTTAINSALESQSSYWSSYSANMDALSAKTGQIAGLSDVLASFADGSRESAAAVAGMAAATDADLQRMVANYQNVQNAQKQAAESMANMCTNYTGEMNRLISNFESQVRQLDMSATARAMGERTISGYISGIQSQYSRVTSAAAALGRAAANAFNSNAKMNMSSVGGAAVKGYASGTTSAPRGVALVGEEGPELVYFRGGERVLTAQQTKVEMGRSNYSTTATAPVNITFNVSGTTDASTIQELRRFASDFEDRVIDVLERRDNERARMAYV